MVTISRERKRKRETNRERERITNKGSTPPPERFLAPRSPRSTRTDRPKPRVSVYQPMQKYHANRCIYIYIYAAIHI